MNEGQAIGKILILIGIFVLPVLIPKIFGKKCGRCGYSIPKKVDDNNGGTVEVCRKCGLPFDHWTRP